MKFFSELLYIILQLTNFYALLQIKTFTRVILVIDFCIHNCKRQILLPFFLGIIADNTFCKDYCHWFIVNLLWWSFSVSSILMYDNFILHYCNWKLFIQYHNEQLLYASLKVCIKYQNSERFIRHILYAQLQGL